jgi:prevent-host-death family protein
MASVSVTDLKAHLSRYLRLARRGTEVQVLERGVPVARIVPMPPTAATVDRAELDRLVRAGIVRRGEGGMGALASRRLRASADLLGALDEDREDRI